MNVHTTETLKLQITEETTINLLDNFVLFGEENIGKSYLLKNMLKVIVENIENSDIFFYSKADLTFSAPLLDFKKNIIEKKDILDLESNINIVEALIEFRKTIFKNKKSTEELSVNEKHLINPTFIILDDMSTTIEHLKNTDKYFELVTRLKAILAESVKYNIFVYISEKDYLNEASKYNPEDVSIYDLEYLGFNFKNFNKLN